MRTLVIAETGSTAECQYDSCCRLIDVVAQAGADVCKTQWTSNPERMCERRQAHGYLDSYRLLAWPVGWHERFARRCHDRGLRYGCTVYLPEDIATVRPFVDLQKVSSFEACDPDFIARHLDRPAPDVVVSAGMFDGHDEAFHQLRLWQDAGRLLLLACTSSYPCPLSALHLARIRACGFDGYSDHSRDVRVGGWAVLAGATIVEAHVRLLDTPMTNKDYAAALAPHEFTAYVQQIREAEQVLGHGEQVLQTVEAPMSAYRALP